MKFSAILPTVFLLATTVIAKDCDNCKQNKTVGCYAICLGLPNPTEDQVLLTNQCNADCTLSGNGTDDCFLSCVKEAYLKTNTKVSSAKSSTKSTQRTTSASSTEDSSTSTSSESSTTDKSSSKSQSQSESTSVTVKSSTSASTNSKVQPSNTSNAIKLGSSLALGTALLCVSYLYL